MTRRVLITGVTGFAGSHLAELVLREHPEVEVYGTWRWRSRMENLAGCRDQVRLVECDLRDPVAVRRTLEEVRPDVVCLQEIMSVDEGFPAGAIERPLANPGPQPAGACRGNTQFRFGTGLYDTTGPLGGNPTGHGDLFGMVVPPQIPQGIDTRLFARAFAIASPCNGKRVVFVSTDLGAISALVRQEVLKTIAADPLLAPFYAAENVMLSATHTHSAGGGFGVPVLPDLSSTLPALINNPVVWLESAVFSNAGFDSDNFQAIVQGIVQAIRRAQANLEAHPQPAPSATRRPPYAADKWCSTR